MKVLEQKEFSSPEDIGNLHIIDFNRCNGLWNNNPFKAIQAVSSMLVGRASYTVIDHDLRMYPDRNDFPTWQHAGDHYDLGRLYWNMFHATYVGELRFSDMPDFSGTLTTTAGVIQNIYGDIGVVSVSSFAVEALVRMNTGDIWVSVLDEKTQVILEATEDIGSLYAGALTKMFGI